MLAVALATVAPWTIRNALALGAFVPIDLTLGRTAWWAYNEAPFNEDLGHPQNVAFENREKCAAAAHPDRGSLPEIEELRRLFPPDAALDPGMAHDLEFKIWRIRQLATRDLVAYQRCEVGNALDFVAARPRTAAARIAQRVYWFWAPNSLLLRAVSWQTYHGGFLDAGTYPFWKAVSVGSFAMLVLAAILSLGSREAHPLREWIALFCVYYTALHAVALAASRYRMPLLPLLCVLASLWLARPGRPETTARRAVVAVLAVAFLAACVHTLATTLP